MQTTYPHFITYEPGAEPVTLIMLDPKKKLVYTLWDGCLTVEVVAGLNMENEPSCVLVIRNHEVGGVKSVEWDSSKIEARDQENLTIHLYLWIINAVNDMALGKGFNAGNVTPIVEELID